MLGKQYLDTIRTLLDNLETDQMDAITRAATLIADAIAAGGTAHRFDTSHVRDEMIYRAGGMLAIRNILFDFDVDHDILPTFDPAKKADFPPAGADGEALARHALRSAHLQKGDVLIVISNSGKSPIVVEAALAAQAAGLKIVALTAVAFSRSFPSQHSSGKRLFEIAQVTIDNGGTAGDAALEVDGLDTPACPTSGVMTAIINWALTAELIEQLLARDITPQLYRSVNLPDGIAHNTQAETRFNQTGI